MAMVIQQIVTIAPNTDWGGDFEVLEWRRVFENGKVALVVNFHGKPKVFHVSRDDIRDA